MGVLRKCAQRIINDALSGRTNSMVICDKPHADLASMVREIYHVKTRDLKIMVVDDRIASDEAFRRSLLEGLETIVLIEPKSFSDFRVNKWLDFSFGMPKVSGLHQSYVSVLPITSTTRVYGSQFSRDAAAKAELLSSLKPNSEHIIVTDSGTRLLFTSRHWISQGNEVLTAPIENSVNGIIAVDGALFFQKIDTVIDFFIKAGELVEIKAKNRQYDDLVEQYRQMTERDFTSRKNRQLAEIGVGFNTGAIISDCFMESEMVYGTCHFCFGNNSCYGGSNISDFHGGSILIKAPRFVHR